MPVQLPSSAVHDDRALDAATLCMYVLVGHNDPSPQSAKAESQTLVLASGMTLDLLAAAGLRPQRLAPDLLVAYPPNTSAAVNTFHLLGNLISGFSSQNSPNPLKAVALLLTSQQSAHLVESNRLSTGLHPFLLNRSESALFLSEDIYKTAKDEPGLTFSRMSPSGQIDGEAFYELTPRATVTAGIPPRQAPLPQRRSIETIPDQLLLVVEKRPRSWTLGLASTLVATLIVLAITLVPRSHHPAKPVAATQPSASSPAIEKATVSPAPTPPIIAAPPPVPVVTSLPPKPTPDVKEKAKVNEKQKDNDQVADDSTPVIQPGKPRVDVFYSQQDIKILLIKADQMTGNGRYDEAIAYYKRVLRQEPQNVEANRGIRRAMQTVNSNSAPLLPCPDKCA